MSLLEYGREMFRSRPFITCTVKRILEKEKYRSGSEAMARLAATSDEKTHFQVNNVPNKHDEVT